MKVRFSHLVLTISVLLLLLTLFLWVRGYWARDGIWYSTDTRRTSVNSYRGRIWFWTLTGNQTALSYIWSTPTKLGPGFVWDSVADSWYVGKSKSPNGVLNLNLMILNAAAVEYPRGAESVDRQMLGFRFLRNVNWLPIAQLQMGYPTARSTAIYIPHWSIALLLGVVNLVLLRRVLRRWRRSRRGLCAVCGYDLRASPDRCPECGATRAAR